ncbi:MAG: hypothetical protein HUU01_05085 [Saprospiraceae bacterium]|nr:hypothetical protein [Saprospiraceae bacterium]
MNFDAKEQPFKSGEKFFAARRKELTGKRSFDSAQLPWGFGLASTPLSYRHVGRDFDSAQYKSFSYCCLVSLGY